MAYLFDPEELVWCPAMDEDGSGNPELQLGFNDSDVLTLVSDEAFNIGSSSDPVTAIYATDITVSDELTVAGALTASAVIHADAGVKGAQVVYTAAGTDTYTITDTDFDDAAGALFAVTFTNASTGASTLNINGAGAQNLVLQSSGAQVGASDISAGGYYVIFNNGTTYMILNA